MKTKFKDFLNESIKDKMVGKSSEEIESVYQKYKEGGDVRKYEEVIGKILKSVIVNDDGVESTDDEIIFEFEDGETYRMYHQQDCCETVTINDINGDVEDLVGVPLLTAEEVVSSDRENLGDESSTWTFYKFATINGYVDIRWHGASNGYYSERVSFKKWNKN